MPSKSSQTHPNMLPFLHASSEIIQTQHKTVCPLNKSTVILSSLHKSYRIYWNLPRSIQTARIHKKSNKSNLIHQLDFEYSQIYAIPLQSAKSLKSSNSKISPDQQQIIKIQQDLCKSRESSQIQPIPRKSTQANRNPTQSSNCNEINSNPSRCIYHRINHNIEYTNCSLSPTTQTITYYTK